MKKVFAIILIVLYASASSGTIINMHYCMGHLSSVRIDNVSLKQCMCGPNEPAGDCCKDELAILKVSDAYQQSVADFTFHASKAVLPSAISLIDINKLPARQTLALAVQDPPDIVAPSPNILHCVFRI